MSREKILIVDDEKNIRDIFSVAFNDYKIVTAASGQEALDILCRPNDIDLIVLDIVMPGLSGTELLREIKRINPDHKVVIFTGHSSEQVAIEALRAHADDYLTKPFDIDKTKEVFECLLSAKKSFDEEGLSNTEGKIKYAQRFINRNYNEAISLTDVTRELFLTPKYFSRMFKEKTGKGFGKYKIGLRIEAAKELLRKNSFSISQIAYKVGYQNPESFMKMFKKFTGFTPSQYCRRIMG